MTVEVSAHAKLRYMQRAGAAVDSVTSEIRDRFETATPTDEQVTDGLGWRADDVILVTDRDKEIVRTVLLAGDAR